MGTNAAPGCRMWSPELEAWWGVSFKCQICDHNFGADVGGNDDLSSLTLVLCHPLHHSFKTKDER